MPKDDNSADVIIAGGGQNFREGYAAFVNQREPDFARDEERRSSVNTVELTPPEAHLRTMVSGLRAVFWTQVSHLASACCVDGLLDGGLLDRQQVPSYELAFAAAELLAAETVLSRPSATGS
jgi:hypothetical protein